jgi:dTMP kinase
MNGFFLTFEGIDGAGKSSHIEPLAQVLTGKGFEVVVTREPGGTPLAEKLRALMLHEDMDPQTEALIAFAARKDHIDKVVWPALQSGKVVICDRFTDSTVAYQGYGKGFQGSSEMLTHLESWVQAVDAGSRVLQPDLTLWFDLDPVLASQRIGKRNIGNGDRFDTQSIDFFQRVHLGYLSRAVDPRFVRVDAHKSLDEVWKDVEHAVDTSEAFSLFAGCKARPSSTMSQPTRCL